MNDAPAPTSLERAEKLQGMGCKRKRVEDVRFTQGRGNYIDDIKLPGMLHGDFHRSSHAHARIVKIDTSKAKAVPGVVAVLTAEDLKGVNLAWMPTLAGDVQMVLADGKVLFQNQEIAFVIATDRYIAADAADLVEVEYEALPVVVDPFKAMDPDAPVLREDIKDKKDGAHGPRNHPNHIFNWQVGDKEMTDAAFVKAEVKTKDLLSYQRVHPCPLETCQCVVSFNKITGDLTIYGTFQAPHVIRTVVALIASLPEQKIHVISPDIGGGFGNKVGAYPGYICAAVASIVTGLPVKWVEDRIENLSTTSFARDYHMTTEIAATREGRVTALRVHILADHGAFDACADPSKWPAGFANIVTGSYDFPVAHLSVDGVYTNKAPGGVAYRCSFRVTEVAYAIERAMDIMAQKLGLDPVDFRTKNFIKREQFPYHSALGWEYDSGDYHTAMQKALDATDYRKLREEQQAKQEAFKRGETRELMGIGVSFFTEIVGAGPSKNCDILGIAMFDSCEIRIHPTGKGIARMGTKSQGQGHETTWAQIIATEIGIPADDIMVEEGNHRHRALWPRHLRIALDSGGRSGDRHGGAQGQGESANDRGLHARSARGRPRMGRRPIPRQRQSGSIQDDEPDRLGRLQQGSPRHGAGPRSGELLRPAEHDLSVRRLYLRDGHRRRHRRPQGEALLRARRLRHTHQSDDHRGSGARGLHRGLRNRNGPGDRLRRGRQRQRRVVHGLFPADCRRDAALGDRLHGHAFAASPDRRQRRRREPERRQRALLRQCGERRVQVCRLEPHSHAP